jgi:soluble lytic murein transglycosylase-like protein
MTARLILTLLASTAVAAPALAQQDPLAPISAPDPAPPSPTQVPGTVTAEPLLPPPIVRPVPTDWRGVFDAIRAEDWGGVVAGINALPDGPLKPVARAEYYTAKNGPRTELGPILALLAEAPDLPQAEQLQRLAMLRGAVEPPAIVRPRPTVGLPMAPRRGRARPVSGEPAADVLRLALNPLVKVDDAVGAEALMAEHSPFLSPDARAEAAQRVAFIYYVLGRDADVRRIADQGRAGAGGEWGAHAAWVSGLAAWRMGDFGAAQAAFGDAQRLAREQEFAACAAYWAARAAQAGHRPRDVQPLLLAAARSSESFYGLLARETLGMATTIPAPRRFDSSRPVARSANVRRASELAAIGERSLAEQMLRHQAKIGSPADQQDLIAVARSLDLGGAQFWLAHNGQPGTRVAAADRYPAPRWNPDNGWRIDPALAYAHVIQESNFRAEAVSPADAVGLMQVRPGTAGDTARARGQSVSVAALKRPETNLDHGQAAIELFRRSSATRGQLPRVIAAYNAGPVPVERWQYINDKGDPLLWIESLPYWETRYYVPAVLRNMWVYQGLAGAAQPTLRALAEHRWPAFPTGTTRTSRIANMQP